jgi:hypothetical protein
LNTNFRIPAESWLRHRVQPSRDSRGDDEAQRGNIRFRPRADVAE